MKTRLHIMTHDELTDVLAAHFKARGETVIGIEAEVHTTQKRVRVKVLTASNDDSTGAPARAKQTPRSSNERT